MAMLKAKQKLINLSSDSEALIQKLAQELETLSKHWTGEKSALRAVAHNESAAQRLAPLARAWETEVRQAFLSAYDQDARQAGLYDAIEPGRGLLGLFELEKVLYELRYEINNRPTWVGIPLQGILDWCAEN